MESGQEINGKEIVKTGVEFPKELLKLVQKRVIDREIRMKDAVREAFESWLQSPVGQKSGPGPFPTPIGVEVFNVQVTLLQTIDRKLDSVIELLRVTHGAIGGIASQQQQEQDRDRTLQQLAEATDEIRRDLATVRTRGKPLPSRPKNALRAG
jgi:hypothetical protein